MKFTVNGHETYCYTGGKAFDAAQPTAIFMALLKFEWVSCGHFDQP